MSLKIIKSQTTGKYGELLQPGREQENTVKKIMVILERKRIAGKTLMKYV